MRAKSAFFWNIANFRHQNDGISEFRFHFRNQHRKLLYVVCFGSVRR